MDYTRVTQGNLSKFDKLINKEQIDFEFLSENIHVTSLNEEYYWNNSQCKNIYNIWEQIFNEKTSNRECIFGAGTIYSF